MDKYDSFVKFYMFEDDIFHCTYKQCITNSKLFYDIITCDCINDITYDKQCADALFYISVYYTYEKHDCCKVVKFWSRAIIAGKINIEGYINDCFVIHNNDNKAKITNILCNTLSKCSDNMVLYSSIYNYYHYRNDSNNMLIVANMAESKNNVSLVVQYYIEQKNDDELCRYWDKLQDNDIFLILSYYSCNHKTEHSKSLYDVLQQTNRLNTRIMLYYAKCFDKKQYVQTCKNILYSNDELTDDIFNIHVIESPKDLLQLESRCLTPEHLEKYYDLLERIYNGECAVIKRYYVRLSDYDEKIEFIELCHNKLVNYYSKHVLENNAALIYKYATTYYGLDDIMYSKYILMAAKLNNHDAEYDIADSYISHDNHETGFTYACKAITENNNTKCLKLYDDKDINLSDIRNIENQLYEITKKTSYCVLKYVKCAKKNHNEIQCYVNLQKLLNTSKFGMQYKNSLLHAVEILEKKQAVIMYNSNCNLFKRLNNYKQCSICLENNVLNINLSCGHEICHMCYPNFTKKCYYNFCRAEPGILSETDSDTNSDENSYDGYTSY